MTSARDKIYSEYRSTFKSSEDALDNVRAEEIYINATSWLEPLIRAVPKEARVLDLGCGAGELLHALKRLDYTQCEGVDVSQEQINLALARDLQASCKDVFEFVAEQPDASVDSVIAFDFIEHFTLDETLTLLEGIHRILKPGGLFIGQTPNGSGLFSGQIIYGDISHVTIFTPSSASQLMRLAGFTQISCREKHVARSGLAGAACRLLWKLFTGLANLVRYVECRKRQTIWTENFFFDAYKPIPSDE